MDVRGRATQEQLPESCRKARPRLTDLAGAARQAPRRVPLSLVTLSCSGHPALRPSGQLRCSHTFLTCAWASERE